MSRTSLRSNGSTLLQPEYHLHMFGKTSSRHTLQKHLPIQGAPMKDCRRVQWLRCRCQSETREAKYTVEALPCHCPERSPSSLCCKNMVYGSCDKTRWCRYGSLWCRDKQCGK